MTFANVDIGTYPADGSGDPLRTAFDKINHNFANVSAGQVTVNAPVMSVAGRTGNIHLVVGDIAGAASIGLVSSVSSAYSMANSANWTSNVSTIAAALDQLAARLKQAGF